MRIIAPKIIGIVLIAILSIAANCSNLFTDEDDKLTLAKRPYLESALRLDGYYYITKNGLMTVYFFYRNGIILHGGDFSPSELAQNEERYKNGQYYAGAINYKIAWGVFHIDSSIIMFEQWHPADASLWAFIRSGEILNDTTFHISQSQRSDGTEQRAKDETYRFKQFAPKPDSVVSFIP